jgi:hypothetical protein
VTWLGEVKKGSLRGVEGYVDRRKVGLRERREAGHPTQGNTLDRLLEGMSIASSMRPERRSRIVRCSQLAGL